MKKMVISIMICLGLAAGVGVLLTKTGSTERGVSEEEGEVDLGEKFKYRQFTPDEQIVKGNQTAVNTIENFYHVKVNVGEDFGINTYMKSDPVQNSDEKYEYLIYHVNNFDESKYSIVYLFHDDTEIIEAISQNMTFVSEDEIINPEYMSVTNERNYKSGAFAWLYEGDAYAILNEEAGYRCSSIWAYDKETSDIYLVFADVSNNPIWIDYQFN